MAEVTLNTAYHVTPPEKFTFSTPGHWPRWLQRFERFRSASGLIKQTEEEQVNALVYFMGDNADEIFSSFNLSAEHQKKYDIVIKRFTDYFIVKRNTIFERAQFNKRVQGEGETVNDFITSLYSLAEYCEYGALHDELIRDKIVVGISDKRLSEKLQLDSELTLSKAMEQVRLSECVKTQQEMLSSHKSSIQALTKVNKRGVTNKSSFQKAKFNENKGFNRNRDKLKNTEYCKWCGKYKHQRKFCPAKDVKCRKCFKMGHFERVCLQKEKSEISFLGMITAVSKDPNYTTGWTVPIKFQNRTINFKIDSGADYTVISKAVLVSAFQNAKVEKPES